MSSNAFSEDDFDLERDLPVTAADVEALRRLRDEVPGWLMLDWRELDACLPLDALDRRALARDEWPPFVLE